MSHNSKRVREQAADLLAILASQQDWHLGVFDMRDFTSMARDLAFDYVDFEVARSGLTDAWRHAYADAEAALRSGVR